MKPPLLPKLSDTSIMVLATVLGLASGIAVYNGGIGGAVLYFFLILVQPLVVVVAFPRRHVIAASIANGLSLIVPVVGGFFFSRFNRGYDPEGLLFLAFALGLGLGIAQIPRWVDPPRP